MKALNYIIGIILLLSLCCCKKEANIKLPEVESVPVIYSYISPADTTIRVLITMSQPLYQQNSTGPDEPVTDAEVIISGNQGEAELNYNPNTGRYELSSQSFSIFPGEKYHLKTWLKNGKFAEAETTVPQDFVPISSASYEKLKGQYSEFNRINCKFSDVAGKQNYYSFQYAIKRLSFNGDTMYGAPPNYKLITDQNRDGAELGIFMDDYNAGSDSLNLAFLLVLRNCNRDYYLLQNSIQNYLEGNPFAEPTLVYSNIKGGLGVFAAYTQSVYRLKY